MEWLWLLAGSGWLAALASLVLARRLARRLDLLTEQYWELKYDHGELKARVRSIDPAGERDEHGGDDRRRAPAVRETFVPLSDIKRPS
jgi:hypothetical protein